MKKLTTPKILAISIISLAYFILLSLNFVSAVGEGYSCEYTSDGPYCDAGLICEFFQCVPDNGGEVTCEDPSYPNLCWIGDISICLNNQADCSEYCCIGGGCDSWDDYWFCNKGSVANCNVQTSNPNNMVCCADDYPIWNEDTQTCWKTDWECTMNSHCGSNENCENHICVEEIPPPECPTTLAYDSTKQTDIVNCAVWQWFPEYEHCSGSGWFFYKPVIDSQEHLGILDMSKETYESLVPAECWESCTPNCIGKKCGPDGCGGSCGTCEEGTICDNGVCIASADCDSNSDCKSLAEVVCDDESLWYKSYSCISGKCSIGSEVPPEDCISTIEKPSYLLQIAIGVIIVFIIGIIIFAIYKRKK